MSVRRTTLAASVTLTLTAHLVAGCGDGSAVGTDQQTVGNEPTGPASDEQTPATGPTDTAAPQPEENQEKPLQIQITIRGQSFTATVHECLAADDLLAQLPVTVEMIDHGGVEKTGRLPAPLSRDGQPEGADPVVGDLGYYAPGNDLVLYYGDQSYFPGIVVLGQLDGDAANVISGMDGAVTATVRAR